MPDGDSGFHQSVPGLLGYWWCAQKDSKRRWESILEAQELYVVGPGSRAATIAHLEDVGDHVEHSAARVTPDVVNQAESADVEDSLGRELTKEKLECWYG